MSNATLTHPAASMAPSVACENFEAQLQSALNDLHALVPPLWPLADAVAVNPCLGLTDHQFLEARDALRRVRNCDLLLSLDEFRTRITEGQLSLDAIEAAGQQCRAEFPDWYSADFLRDLVAAIRNPQIQFPDDDDRVRTVAEAVDNHDHSRWNSHILNDVTRHCAAHYDQGQAVWTSPWKEKDLYTAWREAARISRRMDLLGLRGFRAVVAGLPQNPRLAICEMLTRLDIPGALWRDYLLSIAFSVAGWASFVRYHVRESERAGRVNGDLVGLVALRLAYDVALAEAPGIAWPLPLVPEEHADISVRPENRHPSRSARARYVLQVALELQYRNRLLTTLTSSTVSGRAAAAPALQMVFCIDVRSEVLRRHLESVDSSIETFGFAGFFGMPMEYIPLGCGCGTSQLPVLLQPAFQVHEGVRDVDAVTAADVVQRRTLIRRLRKLWKSVQSSATACFSYVESCGLTYLGKLLTDSFHWTRPVSTPSHDGVQANLLPLVGPQVGDPRNRNLTAQRRVELAEGMLRNLGLTRDFARLVVLCGHASDVTNNPYRAALDCGACGGHSGESNARVAAALLNAADVRSGLAARGIAVPETTWFLAGVHHTTSDTVTLFDRDLVPQFLERDLEQVESWLNEATDSTRRERGLRLDPDAPQAIAGRSRDWAEVRPEWGLAGNAAFVVAPRNQTRGLNLKGRTFLHSYEFSRDPELKVLELIMTAPMVVTNWINMQYYASAVDPVAFGSGNKLIHNVVGQFGVLQGNGGDLMTGLPWQCVHDGERLQHEPLRLTVVIAAPRAAITTIVERHRNVRNLVTNGWISLIAWEGGAFYRWTGSETWQSQSLS